MDGTAAMTGRLLTLSVWISLVVLPFAFPTDSLSQLVEQVKVGPLPQLNLTSRGIVIDSANYTRTTQQFLCGDTGDYCIGWLYMPRLHMSSSGSSRAPPVIVMAHGLGGDKAGLQRYAATFVTSGFAVFSFDYRYWGDSSGMPRRWVSPRAQVDDWLAAVKFVQTNLSSSVDASSLSLWGTSFAGGHVVTVASKLGSQVKSVVSQVPHLDGRMASSLNMGHRGTLGNALLSVVSLADAAATPHHGQYFYVPLAGPAGSLAIMQLIDVELHSYFNYKGLQYNISSKDGLQGDAWLQYVTRASIASELSLNPYSPINAVHNVTAPLLIIAGRRDTLCPYTAAVAAQAKAPNATLLTFECAHFDIYNPPYFHDALAKEVEFLKRYGG